MINVDALDFSEWHSNEVISFFWGSVYIYKLHIYHNSLDTEVVTKTQKSQRMTLNSSIMHAQR